jgi:hypothetical protein
MGDVGAKSRSIQVLLMAPILLWATVSQAAVLDLSYDNLSQLRKGLNNTKQDPIYQYIGIGLKGFPKEISFQTNMLSYIDGATGQDGFDLYQAVFHVEPVDVLVTDVGRQFQSDGFGADLLDGFKVGIFPSSGYLGWDIYAGDPRYIEEGDFRQPQQGLFVGTNFNLQNVKDTTARFSALWKKIDITKRDFNRNDTIYLGLAGSHRFSNAKSTPNIYGDVEYDVAGNIFDVGTLGVDLYPHWRVALNFEGSYFNVNRSLTQRTIMGAFLSGAMGQGRQSAQIKISKSLHFIEDFSYQHYRVDGRGGENSYTAGAGLDHYWKAAKLSSSAKYYYRRSFGGNVNGGLFEFENSYFKNFLADLSFDLSRYTKITGETATATSLVGSLGYTFLEHYLVSVGGEYNHNNWFDREGRITLNFQMTFDDVAYTPEKSGKKRYLHGA